MQLGVAFHSEVWERKANKKHKYKIEEMSELHNTHYVSTASPDRRGGGCAITCDNTKFDALTTAQVTTAQADNCPGDNCPGRQLPRRQLPR